ncbi:MAG: hypothetical protein HGA95_04800, partial [Caldiserica bacterium]|nr:hypothetical protein [Caldisericota bacterium]
MKKVVCSILAMAMIVVYVGCGSEQKPAKESKKPPTADLRETEIVETPEAPAPAEPATPTITDEEPEIIGSADDIVAWRYNIGIGLDRKILVEKGKVFVSYQGDEGYRLLCLDAKTGKQYWDNDCTYYGFDDCQLITTDALVIDCKLKNENFEYDIACYDIQTGKKFCGIMDYPYITSGIATCREFVYFATYDGVLHCFNVYTGKQ